jgi:lysine N6-hydroxylase
VTRVSEHASRCRDAGFPDQVTATVLAKHVSAGHAVKGAATAAQVLASAEATDGHVVARAYATRSRWRSSRAAARSAPKGEPDVPEAPVWHLKLLATPCRVVSRNSRNPVRRSRNSRHGTVGTIYCQKAECKTRHPVLETRFPASSPGGEMRDEMITDAAEHLHEQLDQETGSKCSFAGIGIGPANLSLAALAEPVLDLTYKLFDTRLEFAWHPGLNLPEATLQVSFLKDLVTLVDPTSCYSFLSFLAEKKRLYRFLTANFPAVLRAEYDQYLRWATTVIPGLHFGHEVTAVDFDERNQEFRIETTCGRFAAENLVLGTGLSPMVPEACLPHLGEQVFHASEFAHRDLDLRGQDVVILGGGQTGAEVFLNLIRDSARPRRTSWISRRSNFLPLDDSPFTNELFFPNYAQYFHGETVTRKEQLLSEQKLASDGISASTLDEIYRELYAMECVQNQTDLYELFPENELVGLNRKGDKLVLDIRNTGCKEIYSIEADTLILATGYDYRPPDFLAPLLPRIHMPEKRFKIREDYSLDWDGPTNSKIYVQNAGRHEWGVADPNLSLLSWRSATIINSLVGYPRYDIAETSSALHFGGEAARGADSVECLPEEELDEVF